PSQRTNANPGAGTAVNWTVLPSGYWVRFGLLVTLPLPTTVTVRPCSVAAKLAAMVWFVVTLLNVYVVTAPTDTPSTTTSTRWKCRSGVVVKLRFVPSLTATAPLGEIVPPPVALAVIVQSPRVARPSANTVIVGLASVPGIRSPTHHPCRRFTTACCP